MAQAVWTGSISFGLVSIPVKLYPATEPKDVRFHLYDRRTGKRVRYERVTRVEDAAAFAPQSDAADVSDERIQVEERTAPPPQAPVSRPLDEPAAAAEPVAREDIVRGFERAGGDLVTVTEEELAALAPERSRTIEIEEFVKLAEIDPVFYEKSYLVAPVRGGGAEKPYALLLRAMQGSGMAGIGRFVLRTRPHLVAIRPREGALALETLFFGDEIRGADEVMPELADLAVSERELKTARQLIDAMATAWSPSSHADAYRNELLALLSRKPAVAPAEPAEPTGATRIHDLMAELRASVEAAKRKREAKTPASKRVG